MKKLAIFAIAALALSIVASAAQCTATTKKGERCKRNADPGSIYCWQHKK